MGHTQREGVRWQRYGLGGRQLRVGGLGFRSHQHCVACGTPVLLLQDKTGFPRCSLAGLSYANQRGHVFEVKPNASS